MSSLCTAVGLIVRLSRNAQTLFPLIPAGLCHPCPGATTHAGSCTSNSHTAQGERMDHDVGKCGNAGENRGTQRRGKQGSEVDGGEEEGY